MRYGCRPFAFLTQRFPLISLTLHHPKHNRLIPLCPARPQRHLHPTPQHKKRITYLFSSLLNSAQQPQPLFHTPQHPTNHTDTASFPLKTTYRDCPCQRNPTTTYTRPPTPLFHQSPPPKSVVSIHTARDLTRSPTRFPSIGSAQSLNLKSEGT